MKDTRLQLHFNRHGSGCTKHAVWVQPLPQSITSPPYAYALTTFFLAGFGGMFEVRLLNAMTQTVNAFYVCSKTLCIYHNIITRMLLYI